LAANSGSFANGGSSTFIAPRMSPAFSTSRTRPIPPWPSLPRTTHLVPGIGSPRGYLIEVGAFIAPLSASSIPGRPPIVATRPQHIPSRRPPSCAGNIDIWIPPSSVFLLRASVQHPLTDHYARAISGIQSSFASITALAAVANVQAATIPQPTILPCGCVASEAAIQPALAPYTAAGTESANIIHPAGAAKTTAASRGKGAHGSPLVAQKGFTGAARL